MLTYFDTIFRHPAVVAAVSVLLGTWLFGHISYRRSRQDAIRAKALEFLDEVAKAINTPLSELYKQIREQSPDVSTTLSENVSRLFTLRFAVRIKSKAYLESEIFWKTYDEITWELSRTLEFLRKIKNCDDMDALVREIEEANEGLGLKWGVTEQKEILKQPYSLIMNRPNIIWNRANSLLSNHVAEALKAK